MMLSNVFALPILLIATSIMAQAPDVDQPQPVSSGSSVQRLAVPISPVPVAATPAPTRDDVRRDEARRRAFLMLLLNSSGGHVQPFGGMSH
jgi:hypothetical protein